jgi:hypothetical protein
MSLALVPAMLLACALQDGGAAAWSRFPSPVLAGGVNWMLADQPDS